VKIRLKEHIEKILDEKEKALNAALISNDKRLDLLNELRGDVATKAELKAVVEKIDTLQKLVYIGVGGVLVIEFLSKFIFK